MDIGRVLKDSWAIFVKDWGALIVAALIMVLLGVVTLGILFVPLSAGLYLMILRRVREGRKAEVGDVFGCFDRLGAYLVAYVLFLGIGLVFAVIVGLPLVLLVIHNTGARAFGGFLFALALVAAIVVGVYLETIWVYWTILMVDRRRTVTEALRESRELVMKTGFWMTLLVIALVGVSAGIAGSVLASFTLGLGGFLTFLFVPWEMAAYTSMYLQSAGEGALLPSAYAVPSSAWQGGGAFNGYVPPGYGPPPPGYGPSPPGYGPSPPGYGPPPGYGAASGQPVAPPAYPPPPAYEAAPAYPPPPGHATPPPYPSPSGHAMPPGYRSPPGYPPPQAAAPTARPASPPWLRRPAVPPGQDAQAPGQGASPVQDAQAPGLGASPATTAPTSGPPVAPEAEEPWSPDTPTAPDLRPPTPPTPPRPPA
jgi:hypothetical protein